MAKTKNNKQKNHSLSVHEGKFGQLKEMFPKVQLTKLSEKHPRKAGRDFIVEITLPNEYTLLSKGVASNGEITSVTFSVPKKVCTENQIPGIYHFSA